MTIFYQSLLILFIISFLSFYISIHFSNYLKLISKKYDAIQKIHEDFVPPIGGFLIITLFFLFMYLFKPSSFILKNTIIFPALLIFVLAFLDDMFMDIKPILRFINIFICSLIYISFNNSLPIIDIVFINDIFTQYPLIEILFYTLGLTTLANGSNMIDGMNGLAGMVLLSMIIGLSSLLLINDIFKPNYNSELISLGLLITVFLLFNFPFGKIFLGDSGAYTIGWIVGIILMEVFSSNKIPTWTAVLIISYPVIEVIFSTLRKLIQKKNPLYPDLDHIHLKLFYLLKGKTKRENKFNSFTTLCLMPLWFLPSTMVVWVHFYSHLSWLAILIMISIYIYFYLAIPKVDIVD